MSSNVCPDSKELKFKPPTSCRSDTRAVNPAPADMNHAQAAQAKKILTTVQLSEVSLVRDVY